MRSFKITNPNSGMDLGTFQGADEQEALEAFARDAGYGSYAEACEVAPAPEGGLLVEEVEEVELRLYEHPETRATCEDREGEVDAHGWDYAEGDTVLIGRDRYTITQVYDAIQTGDTRGNYICATAQK